MKPEEIKAARNATPFFPFRIVFADGRKVNVLRRDGLFITKDRLIIGIDFDPRTGIPEEGIMDSAQNVVRIEFLAAPA